ncbi:MAG: DUF1653 domain-containing protein [Minisyncoccota bacterium]
MPLTIPKKVIETGFYCHYKHNPSDSVNNHSYEVIYVGTNTETKKLVIYRSLYQTKTQNKTILLTFQYRKLLI